MKIGYFDRTLGALLFAVDRNADRTLKDCGANLGNLAFLNAARLLVDASLVPFDWSTPPESLRTEVDALLFPVANWLNPTVDLSHLAKVVKHLDKPVILMGLGAQSDLGAAFPSLKQGTIDFVVECAKRTPAVLVRGPYTEKVCASFGVTNTIPAGCPSLFTEPLNSLGRTIEKRWHDRTGKVAFHALEIKEYLRDTERQLYRLAFDRQGSALVVQHQTEIVDLILSGGANLSADQQAKLQWYCKYLAPGADVPSTLGWLRANTFFFDGIDGWRRFLRNFCASINTRIHGTILSLSSGVPAVCLHHDSRTKELAETMAIPTLLHAVFQQSKFDVDGLFDAVKFNGEAFDRKRAELGRRYLEVFKAVNVPASRHLVGICE